MRYRLRFIYQFAALAAVALLAVVGLGLFELRDQAQTDAILHEQEQLLELKLERVSPSIVRAQDEVDALLAANAERLLVQRGDAFARTVVIFAAALVFIATLMFLQIRSARQLAARLDLLAEGMGEIAAGQFMKVMDLPHGSDEVGQLGQTFKNMATQIQAQILAIQQERENAELANRVKSQFLATMSHEIRTPLNAVLGMLELLENSELDAEQREYAAISRRAAQELMQLLYGILDLSRIEAEKLELEQVPFSLQAVIGQTVSLFGPMAREKELVFAHFVDRKIPPRLLGDAERIRQVLANLVGNAIKFTERGQVKLALQQVDAGAGYVELQGSVEDTGPGIPVELHQEIFTPFTQVDTSMTRQRGGLGLGLAICARLIELMGGRIWVESQEGEGASFFFSLTLAVADADGRDAAAKTDEIPADMAEKLPLKILFVDDIESNLSIALQNFSLMGYEIDVAKNGFEAVERAQRCAYDLIFMDIQMPGMNGLEASKIILSTADIGRQPRIIAVTGYSSQVDDEAVAEAGMVALLSKPFRHRDLHSIVETWGG
jgi:signal transduction histidine kinase